MKKIEMQTITTEGVTLSAMVILPDDIKGILLYLHGGGLIFGKKDDLPDIYLEMLVEAGYGVIAFDYLLAPESKLDVIIESVAQQINWYFTKGRAQLNLEHVPFTYIMGRSAGAYLAIQMIQRFPDKFTGLISFYGYYQLTDAHFAVPNRHYLAFGKVSDRQYQKLLSTKPLASGDDDERYLMYLYARQRGNWQTILLPEGEKAKNFSVNLNNLQQFPPSFIAVAKDDIDVPSKQSKMLAKYIPEAELHVLESAEHDFDRTQMDTLGIHIYQTLTKWLQTVTNK